MAKKHTKPSHSMVLEAFALARELGWVSLNEQELHLIKLLRHTTYHGRNIVIDVATAMRRAHPWVDSLQGVESNTRTTHPATDRRFFTNLKEK